MAFVIKKNARTRIRLNSVNFDQGRRDLFEFAANSSYPSSRSPSKNA